MSDRMITEYEIVSNTNIYELQQAIKQRIKDGWQPYGTFQMAAPVMNPGEVAALFAQAVVKYK